MKVDFADKTVGGFISSLCAECHCRRPAPPTASAWTL